MPQDDIIVKFVSYVRAYTDHHATRQFPDSQLRWGRVKFVFDANCTMYDWLVVYHDIPKVPGRLAINCPPENTIFITYEPSAIFHYNKHFAAQFNWLLSCHEEWALPHKNRIPMQPGSIWYYGSDVFDETSPGHYEYPALYRMPPPDKTKTISTVCSNKAKKHALHYRRLQFTRLLEKQLPEMDRFGNGARHIKQKADALDDYRYHLTIENDRCPHYWTEKLSDAFLGYTLPLYCGCPNIKEYFPPQSLIEIDIDDPQKAIATVKTAIANDEYEKRLPHIIEARRRVLEEHNLYAMVARVISKLPAAEPATDNHNHRYLYHRHKMMFINPWIAAHHRWHKIAQRLRIRYGQR